jgi:hypothetical protein
LKHRRASVARVSGFSTVITLQNCLLDEVEADDAAVISVSSVPAGSGRSLYLRTDRWLVSSSSVSFQGTDGASVLSR